MHHTARTSLYLQVDRSVGWHRDLLNSPEALRVSKMSDVFASDATGRSRFAVQASTQRCLFFCCFPLISSCHCHCHCAQRALLYLEDHSALNDLDALERTAHLEEGEDLDDAAKQGSRCSTGAPKQLKLRTTTKPDSSIAAAFAHQLKKSLYTLILETFEPFTFSLRNLGLAAPTSKDVQYSLITFDVR